MAAAAAVSACLMVLCPCRCSCLGCLLPRRAIRRRGFCGTTSERGVSVKAGWWAWGWGPFIVLETGVAKADIEGGKVDMSQRRD